MRACLALTRAMRPLIPPPMEKPRSADEAYQRGGVTGWLEAWMSGRFDAGRSRIWPDRITCMTGARACGRREEQAVSHLAEDLAGALTR